MKILFVCHRLPFPPTRGGKIRPFNIIKHLNSQGHKITVASLARSPQELDEGSGLRDFCSDYIIESISSSAAAIRMVARLPTFVPSSMGNFYSPRLARRIKNALINNNFDLIIVHCSSVAGYVAGHTGAAKLLDLGDIDSQKWLLYAKHRAIPLAAGYWLEGIKLERAEKQLARQFDLCTCTTKAELATFESFETGIPGGWFPNGVDTDYFAPISSEYDPNMICFMGRMDYYPNQDAMLTFCKGVLPLIRRQRPETQLQIVGARPPGRIIALGELPGVTVTGSVEDVRPYIQRAALTVAPLAIARGTQNKILESMAMGIPVVVSDKAAPGVDAVPGEHLFVADSPQSYRDAILCLLESPEQRTRLAKAGRKRVLACQNWERSMLKLDDLIEDCISHSRRKTDIGVRSAIDHH